MAFTPEFLDEIRTRVRLSDVIARKVKLQRAGQEFKGRCPFHSEKTPSFYVNDQKQFYHCFGCGAHGDVIRFLCEAEGRSFPEAVRELAGQAGLEVPEDTPEDRDKAARLTGLRAIMEAAQGWFAEQLQGLAGADARVYVEQRGLSRETVRRFGLGFAPDRRDGLRTALMAQGASEAELVECGLLIALEDGSKTPYDRFRGRLMFPIRDPRGRVIAFGGRALGDAQPKYLNSPDTPLFDKGRTLYNLDQAAAPGRKADRIHVVEGYMDVIALAQAGIETAVAPLGTALTAEQMQLLWRVAPEPLLCFDGDAAGQRAAVRAALRALPLLRPGMSLRFALLPAGEDPDTLVRSRGAAAFGEITALAEPLADLVWRSELEAADLSTPERRAAFKTGLRDLVRTIAHPDVRDLYGQEFAARLDALFGPARSAGGRATRGGPTRTGSLPASAALRATRDRLASDRIIQPYAPMLIRCVLNHPDLLDNHLESFARLPVAPDGLQALQGAIIDAATRHSSLDSATLRHHLASQGFERLMEAIDTPSRQDLPFSRSPADAGIVERGFVFVLDSLTRMSALDADLAQATAALVGDPSPETFERQQAILHEQGELARRLRDYATLGADSPEG